MFSMQFITNFTIGCMIFIFSCKLTTAQPSIVTTMYNKRNDRLECYNQKVADARIKVPKKNIIDLRKENNKGLDQQYLRHEV